MKSQSCYKVAVEIEIFRMKSIQGNSGWAWRVGLSMYGIGGHLKYMEYGDLLLEVAWG
jgi:hypothetical protein